MDVEERRAAMRRRAWRDLAGFVLMTIAGLLVIVGFEGALAKAGGGLAIGGGIVGVWGSAWKLRESSSL